MTARRDDRSLAELAKNALRNGQANQAAAFLQQARHKPPRDAATLRTLANVALVLRDQTLGVEFLEAAIAAHSPAPAPAAWYRVLGEACFTLGNLNQAIHAFRATLAETPDDADTWRWLARVLRRVDDLPGALAACRHAVQLSPAEWPALGDLALVLTDAGAFDEAASLFDEALALACAIPALVVGRAKLDAHCGRRPQAIAALRACVARHPTNASALATLALALRDEGRFDDSVATFRQAIAQVPGEAAFWCGLGRTLLEAGLATEALTIAASYLERRPGHAGALSLDVLGRLAVGDRAGAEYLLDYDRFVVRRKLPVPAGFDDLTSFNLALAAVTSTHPTLHRAPLRHATAAGLHSGSLLIDPPGPIESLQRALQVALAEYCRALPDLPTHPFVSQKPQSTRLDIWCVVMQRGGHQIPHIHPEAWLSGVYYPLVPEGVRSGECHEGWLVFGEPDRNFPRKVELPPVRVRPEEGLLVLFPSYFFHGTIPFEASGTRLSVAFDVIAAV